MLVAEKGQTVGPQMLDHLGEVASAVFRALWLSAGFLDLVRRRIEKAILAERQFLGSHALRR